MVKEGCLEDESTRVFNLSDLKEEFGDKTILDFVNEFYKENKAFIISNIVGSIMLGLMETIEFWYTTPVTILKQCLYSIIFWNIFLFIFFLIYKKVVIDLIKLKLIVFFIFFIGNFFSFVFSALITLSFQSKETKAIHYTNENIELCSNISSSREYKKCYETIVNIKKLSNQAQIDSFGKSLNKLHKEKPSVHTKDLLTLFAQKKYKELTKEVQIQRKKQKALRRKQKHLEEK